jgi:CheY-like chemotaxis protein
MAAIDAVLGLKPSKPFPGSSFVVEALGYLVASFGAPKALAADARPQEVEFQAGLLATLGYDAEAATSDRAALAEAIASPDFEVALIDFSLAAPVSGQLLEQFRRDNRTARLPIGIVASSDDLESAERLARRTPLTAVVVRTRDPGGLRFQIDLLLEKLGRSAVSSEERRSQAAQAVAWLREMSKAPRGLYNLRGIEPSLASAVWDPELGPQATEILATLGTASSQRVLVDLASFVAQPLELRQAAAKAFAVSVADFGALLTSGEIHQQYDRYNRSETQDQATQKVLASILDVVEARAVADQAD